MNVDLCVCIVYVLYTTRSDLLAMLGALVTQGLGVSEPGRTHVELIKTVKHGLELTERVQIGL